MHYNIKQLNSRIWRCSKSVYNSSRERPAVREMDVDHYTGFNSDGAMVPESVTFESLPPEIREYILSSLDTRSLLSACCVSKSWYGLISSSSVVWYRACRSLRLLMKDGIQWEMSRDRYLSLAKLCRSVQDDKLSFRRRIFAEEESHITTIYHNNGRLATGSLYGVVILFDCASKHALWINKRSSLRVTSIKFDDSIGMASYSDGKICSWNTSTGTIIRDYNNPCASTTAFDYMTEGNLVLSVSTKIVVWNMSNGKMLLEKDLDGRRASQIVIGSYPDGEYNVDPTVQRMMVACRVENDVVVWKATAVVDKSRGMNVTMQKDYVIKVGCPNRCPPEENSLLGSGLHFDGKILYFTKHSPNGCSGVIVENDVLYRRSRDRFWLGNKLRVLLAVGKKYMLVVLSDKYGDYMDIIPKENGYLGILCPPTSFRPPKLCIQRRRDVFCVGSTSWLDGFDGKNHVGQIFFHTDTPYTVWAMEWKH